MSGGCLWKERDMWAFGVPNFLSWAFFLMHMEWMTLYNKSEYGDVLVRTTPRTGWGGRSC